MGQDRRHEADHAGSCGAAQSRETSGPRVLVLGGSSDGFAAAEALDALGFDVVTSFAGVTETRRRPAGRSRVGGFGGVEGLRGYLAAENIASVVDATHPFASAMSANAARACAAAGVPVVHVVRPPWTLRPGDDWRRARDLEDAAAMIPETAGPCFLTVGRMKIAPFAGRRDLSFVIRTVDPPAEPFDHPKTVFVHDRGPFPIERERALFEAHRFGSLVTANSGGAAAAAKLDVARERGLPVVIVDRPLPPEGFVVETAAEAVAFTAGMLLRASA